MTNTALKRSAAVVAVVAAFGPALVPAPASAAITEAIAFTTYRDGNFDIYAMNPDGSGETRLTTDPSIDADPVISPDGESIVFTSFRDGNMEIYSMNADGSGQTRLTANDATDSAPAFSPGGDRIVFTSTRDGSFDIYVMDADGANVTRLTTSGLEFEPAFSPDGTRIAFKSFRDGGDAEIYAMNADGSGQTRLTFDESGDTSPAYSPDGSLIAFSSTRDAGDAEIYLMNADGSAPSRVTNSFGVDTRPAFSPDGTRIAFTSDRTGNGDIHVLNLDGTGTTALTTSEGLDDDANWVAAGPSDTTAPQVTCAVTSETSVNGNSHKLIPVTTAVTVVDEEGGSGAAGFTLVSVASSQADAGLADDDEPFDVQDWTAGEPDTEGLVRLERYGESRVYTLTYEGRDEAGNAATCSATVTILRGRRDPARGPAH